MSTTTDTQVLTVEAAQSDLNDARQFHSELESRLRDGDLSISIDQITEAGQKVAFGELRLEGAKASSQRLEDAERQEAAEALHAEFTEATATTTGAILKAHDGAVKALAKLAEAVGVHNSDNDAYASRLEQLRPSQVSLGDPLPTELKNVLRVGSHAVGTFSPVRIGLAVVHQAFASMDNVTRNLKADEADAVRTLRERNPAEVELVRTISELASKATR